jgi:tetrapyrrole methylase family protein / MazG family protein
MNQKTSKNQKQRELSIHMNSTNGITILGLGPGSPDQLTRQAWDWLNRIPTVYLRTRQHPTVASFPAALEVRSFDDYYEQGERFEDVYEQIIQQVLALGRTQSVTYAVPGNPMVAEATGPEILRRASAEGIPVQVIDGLSFLEPTFSALGLDPFPQMALVDAITLGGDYVPSFPPSQPALIAQIYSRETASNLKLTLMSVYPDEFPVRLVHAAGTEQQVVEDLKLFEIDRSPSIGLLTSLYLPPLGEHTSLESFQEVVAHLRDPETGCPWDKEQTHNSLRTYLLEETYEALEALDQEDPVKIQEEFGDLLLQIVLHAQIAAEEGEFTMADIIQGINRKIIHRHPHVFGDVQVKGVSGVLQNWEKLKAEERKENGNGEKGLLDSVPKILAALAQAQQYQDRAARVGFDWADIDPVKDKIFEELKEVEEAPDSESLASELGDLLFAVVNLTRWYKVDAESVLRETNQRFRRRFAYIEQKARQLGRNLNEMTLEEMDVFWEEAKDLE